MRRPQTPIAFRSAHLLAAAAAVALGACGDASLQPAANEEALAAPVAAALRLNAPVVISQLYGGGGNASAPFTNDFVELFNRSDAPVDVTGWSVQYASATGTGSFGNNPVVAVSGVLQPGQYFLVQLAGGATGGPLPPADASGTINMSATAGKVVLVASATGLACNGGSTTCSPAQESQIQDLVGYGGANYFETTAAPALSNTSAGLRDRGGCEDTNNNAADFSAGAPGPRTRASALAPCDTGDAAPAVASVSPADGATDVGPAAPITITFNEAVTAPAAAFAVSCSISGAVGVTVSGGPMTYTLDHAAPFARGESCTVTVSAGQVADVDTADPPDTMVADQASSFTVVAGPGPLRIHDVQGRSHRSPVAGQTVSAVPGIVTFVRNNGFYLQDPAPDADDATSEAMFVFTGSAPAVLAGDEVLVSGPVVEFRPGCSGCAPSNSAFANLTTTEIERPTAVAIVSRGNPLPPPVAIGPNAGERRPPSAVIDDDTVGGDVEVNSTFDPANDGLDFYESLEAMRVSVSDPVAVGRTSEFAGTPAPREIPVLARNGAGAGLRTTRGGIVIAPGDFNPERIILANTLVSAMPLVNVADRFAGAVVGLMDYSFGNFKLFVSEPLPPVAAGGLTREISTISDGLRANELTTATLNVENLDNGDPDSKFAALAQIVVSNLKSPDVVALEEVQDNNGPVNDAVVDASQTLQRFAQAITTAGGPSYQFRSINPVDDQDGGEPGGNIRVVLMYRAGRGLSFVDRPGAGSTTANQVVNNGGAPQLLYSPGRLDPTNAAFTSSRKPLAAELSFNGRALFLVVNHFNSKGGDNPLFGRLQPPALTSEAQRLQQAQIVADFVRSLLAVDSRARVLVMGDLNDFQFSAPLQRLKDAGLTTLIEKLPASERYSYVFEGNSQVLDHIMVSPSLSHAAYDVVHVNSEFAEQSSDHDPSVARFTVMAPTRSVQPIVECVVRNRDGTHTARFGYLNEDDEPISLLIGLRNLFLPLPMNRGQPISFAPGRQVAVFNVTFPKGDLTWVLAERSATATTHPSQRCQ